MRFVHSSDFHIGAGRDLPDYLDRYAKMIDDVVGVAKERDVKIILIAGDLWHRKDTTVDERNMLINKLLSYDEQGFQFMIIRGNGIHEFITDSSWQTRLIRVIYEQKKFKQSKVADFKPEMFKVEEKGYILCIPHNGWSTDKLGIIIHANRKVIPEGSTMVVMAHETISGSILDNGHVLEKGSEIDSKWPYDYFGLGDIHCYQQIGERAFYCGSPIQHNFGDSLPKGVMYVDTEKKIYEFVEIKSKPLITLTELPKDGEQLQDAYYKLQLKDPDLLKFKEKYKELPNVVKTEIAAETKMDKIVIDVPDEIDLLQGLPEFMADAGHDKEDQEFAVQSVKYAIGEIS